MPKFGTREWVEQYCKEINKSEGYRSSAARWEGAIIFVVRDLPEDLRREIGSTFGFKLDLWHGECRGFEYYDESSLQQADAPYIIEADYATWMEVISGRLPPIPALITGKLKLKKGSLASLIPYVAASLELIKAAQKVGV